MEGCVDAKKHDGKTDKKTASTKFSVVKFSVSKGLSASSFSLSRCNDDAGDGNRFAVSFEDSKIHMDDLDKADNRSQTPEPPKLSKPQQILSAWKKTGIQNKTLSRLLREQMHPSPLNPVKLETSDCESDSTPSCSFENESRSMKSATVAGSKKSPSTTPPSQRLEVHSGGGNSDRESVGSNESSSVRTEKASRLSVIFDKAKSKGRKLVSSHKNKKDSGDTDSIEEPCRLITVGQDALCMETESETLSRNSATESSRSGSTGPSSVWDCFRMNESTGSDKRKALNSQPLTSHFLIDRIRYLPLLRCRIVCLIALLAVTFVSPGFVSGFLWGLYLSFVGFLYFFVSEPVNREYSISSDVVLNIKKELDEQKTLTNDVYKGWMNELSGRYSPTTYHVNNSQTVLVRLDRNLLRISRPERAVLKHGFHTDPTLTEAEPAMCGQSIYDLTGAVVSLRPKRLAKRRWWSRKYPIHIRLASKESEITMSPALRRSHSVNEAIELAKSAASSDDETVDTDNDISLAERKKKTKTRKVMETSRKESVECISYSSSSEEELQDTLCSRNEHANSVDDMTSFASEHGIRRCKGTAAVARGRCLYFFVRSAREKERWFHRLRETCSQYSTKTGNIMPSSNGDEKEVSLSHFGRRLSLPLSDAGINSSKLNLEYFLYVTNHVQFNKCISEILNSSFKRTEKSVGSCGFVCMDLGRNKWTPRKPDSGSQLAMSANALAARIFYDFSRDAYWCKKVQNKIQSKLATVHLPYFIETLELSNLDLGATSPEIVAVYPPILDDWGLWIDFELKYGGGIHLTLETKANVMKLKDGLQKNEMFKEVNRMKDSIRVHHYSDSDLPESPESSPDEDFGSKTEKSQQTKESTGKKLLNVVDKIASSNIFQGASELKPVKKVMEGISSTRLLLNVDVTHLEGTMTVNIPPPPSDRLWYAFRTPPQLSIRCVPQVGDRSVDMSTVSNWIENKLRQLLEKNLVCPNMDDLIVPVMSGNELLKGGGYNC